MEKKSFFGEAVLSRTGVPGLISYGLTTFTPVLPSVTPWMRPLSPTPTSFGRVPGAATKLPGFFCPWDWICETRSTPRVSRTRTGLVKLMPESLSFRWPCVMPGCVRR
jgi:hypothetical protein